MEYLLGQYFPLLSAYFLIPHNNIMKFLILFLLIMPCFAHAKFGLEISAPQSRFEFNQNGVAKPFITSNSLEYKLYYQHSTTGSFTWGLSFYNNSMGLLGGDDSNLNSNSVSRTKISGYIAGVLSSGLFGQFGIDRTSTPYFFEENSEIRSENVSRMDIFFKFGLFYQSTFGGGEISYKYMMIPGADVNGQSLAGSGTEVYFNIFINKAQNFGLYFNYSNEFVEGDYDHVFDSRALGVLAQF